MANTSATKSKSPFRDIAHLKKRAFLGAYAECGSVAKAAKTAGISRRSHQLWMKASGPGADAYREAFAEAHEMACDMLEAEARTRAVEGTRRYKFYRGRPILDPRTGEPYFEHDYSDTLLIFLLKGARPEKYRERYEHSGPDGGPIQMSQYARIVEDEDWYGNRDRIEAAKRRQNETMGVSRDP